MLDDDTQNVRIETVGSGGGHDDCSRMRLSMRHLDHEAWVEGSSSVQTHGPEDIGILEQS